MRSASAICLLAVLLSGCATTQQEAARLQLNSARIRVSQTRTRVVAQTRLVRVTAVKLIRGHGGSALVVELRNVAGRTLTDLPISVGMIQAGRRHYFNDGVNGDYFDAHISAIGSGQLLDWVFTTRHRIAARARLFALVGGPQPGFSSARTLPRIEVYPSAAHGGTIELTVRSLTPVPQYDLQVYATVTRANRLLAAGRVSTPDLGGDGTTRLRLRLFGKPTHTNPAIQAPATIFG